MQKYKKFIKPIVYTITFIFFIIISYRSAKPRYKPEHFTDIFKDFSWLGNWPKWLDFPLMQPLNAGVDWLIVKYGLFFEGINNFLLGLYTSMKNSLVGLPWPIVIALVIFITYFASGRKANTTIMVAFCTFFLGFFISCKKLGFFILFNFISKILSLSNNSPTDISVSIFLIL